MSKWANWFVTIIVGLALVAGVYWAMRERPASVDIASVASAPMQVSIQEEGVTRVRDVYSVSSPISGRLDRIRLDEGQAVKAGETLIASVHPSAPPFLDRRTQRDLQSALDAAQSAVALAEVEHERAQMALILAQSEYDRSAILAEKKIQPLSQLEKDFNTLELQKAQVKSTQATIDLRKAELARANARLEQPSESVLKNHSDDCCVQVRAPVDGVVLSILARSEQVVAAGARLVEIGDPRELEIVIDLLSSDAAGIKPGATVLISEWGGPERLRGTVRRVDPAAFTKVSSLGIEEQRVNVIIDLDKREPALGHGFRVIGNLVVWQGDDVLQVPIGALFRSGGSWAVFLVRDGRAQLRMIEIGHMNRDHAEIVSGLRAGDAVILYPNDELKDGSLVERRNTASG